MTQIILILMVLNVATHALTLDDAIQRTKQNNNALELEQNKVVYKISKDATIEDVQGYLPSATLFYNYSNANTPQFAESHTLKNISVRWLTNHFTTKNYGITFEYDAMNILKTINKVGSINFALKASHANQQNKDVQFYYTLVTTYLDLYKATESLRLYLDSLHASELRYKDMSSLFKYGRVSKRDYLMSRADYMRSNMDVRKAQNVLINSKKKYKDLFSDIHEGLVLPNVELNDVAPTLASLLNKLENSNAEIINLRYTSQILQREATLQRMSLLPKINLGYKYSIVMPDYDLFRIPDYRQGMPYVNASMNLLNIKNFFAGSRNESEAQKNRTQAKILHRNYTTEAENLWNDTKYQEELGIVLQEVINYSKEIYKITKDEVKVGQKSMTDELLVKQEYTNAEIKLLESKTKKIENIYRLKLLTGTL